MEENKKTYWKSYEEFANDSTYVESVKHEFAEGTVDGGQDFLNMTRRKFLGLLGASVALATTSCRKPLAKIIPYVKHPESTSPGVTQFYASTFSLNNSSQGILVKTKDGRPIKIEGNPDHPLSQGATHTFAQASVLGLYDPDRKRKPTISGKIATWEQMDHEITNILKSAKAIRLLTESTSSPSLRNVFLKFDHLENAKWFEYEPLSQENQKEALSKSCGWTSVPKMHVDRADILVSFNADFLGGTESIHVKNWSQRRKIRSPKDTMNRLYVVESYFSITGTNADHRLPVKPSELLPLALALAKTLVFDFHLSSDSEIKSTLSPVPFLSDEKQTFVKALAQDLVQHKGRSLVMVGPQESSDLQVVGLFLNDLLGNFGKTLDPKVETTSFYNGIQTLKPLLSELESNKIDVLITVGGNPLYHLPSMKDALSRVKHHIRLSLYQDETAELAQYVCPLSHPLESWGDSRPEEGILSLQQPTIQPLHDSRCEGETLLSWINILKGKEIHPGEDWLSEIKSYWKMAVYPNSDSWVSFDEFWEGALHDGILRQDKSISRNFHFQIFALREVVQKIVAQLKVYGKPNTLELQVHPSYAVYDGRFANNGWLQELPDPITKTTWDNLASMSPKTALKLGVKEADVIEITAHGATIQLPVFLQPGLSENVITTAMGYGRTHAGEVGTGVGSNVLALGPQLQWDHVEVKKTGQQKKIATTQGHNYLEGRPIVREASLEEYKKHPDFPKHALHYDPIAIYPEHEYKGHRWGMAIDLNSCVGCSGCVIACDSENNIPVIGKTQVLKGREMQWLRIDRYYEGSDENPKVVHQPMLCQQCGNAPCENVCPVGATTHSPEGLNDMTYNRCVGTRYCSNNCPYKVRRFNFLNFNAHIESPMELAKNPDVTIRMRGVMEKCTFCVQRINEGKINAKMKGDDRVSDGQIKTACQQSCPADAIVFGDLNDPTSEVTKLSKLSHGYHVLEELNTRPSITYLAKVRNPNPLLENGDTPS